MNSVTPEFVLWSIGYECPLRDEIDDNSGHSVLRHLRPLRAWSDCREHGRMFEGICVQISPNEVGDPAVERKGFRAGEMFDYYGGEEFVREQCKGCPANVSESFCDEALAGCAGMLQVDVTDPPLSTLVSIAIRELDIESLVREYFLPTTDHWCGIWARSPLDRRQLELLDQIFSHLFVRPDFTETGTTTLRPLVEFHEAILRSLRHDLALHVELFPTGVTTPDKDWIVHAHCYDCKSPMDDADRKCARCGRVGGPHPKLRRRARGDRPYWSLSGFLGKEGAADFLTRYRDSKQLE